MNTGHAKARTLDLGTHLITPYPLGHLDCVIIIYVLIKRYIMHTTSKNNMKTRFLDH